MSVLKLHRNAPLVELWACAALANLTASDTQGSTGTVDNVNRAVTVGIGGEIVRYDTGAKKRIIYLRHNIIFFIYVLLLLQVAALHSRSDRVQWLLPAPG